MMWMNIDKLFMRGKVSFFKKKILYLLQESTSLLKQQTVTHELEAPTEWEEKGFDYITYNLFLVIQKLTLIKSVKIMCSCLRWHKWIFNGYGCT